MKAYVVFSSTEPVLVVSRQTIRSPPVLDELRRIGCLKFIAREVPIEQVRCLYGRHYDIVEEAIDRGCPLRVLDYNGRRIFRWLPFSDFGPPYQKEMSPTTDTASRSSIDARGQAEPTTPAAYPLR
jgi:hypothetical protein